MKTLQVVIAVGLGLCVCTCKAGPTPQGTSPILTAQAQAGTDIGQDQALQIAKRAALGLGEPNPQVVVLAKTTYAESQSRWPSAICLATIPGQTPVWAIDLRGTFNTGSVNSASILRMVVQAADGSTLSFSLLSTEAQLNSAHSCSNVAPTEPPRDPNNSSSPSSSPLPTFPQPTSVPSPFAH